MARYRRRQYLTPIEGSGAVIDDDDEDNSEGSGYGVDDEDSNFEGSGALLPTDDEDYTSPRTLTQPTSTGR